MVAFNSIPSTLLTPFVAVEIDGSRAASGPQALAYRALLIGQKLTGAPAAANSLHNVTSAEAVAALTGRGSQLHREALAFFAENRNTDCWIGVLADDAAATHASGTFTISGTPTAAGTLSAYVGGELVSVPVTTSDTPTTIAAALAAAIGAPANGTVTVDFLGLGAGDNYSVGGVTFVGTVGAVTPGAATYSVDTSENAAAASLAAQINAHTTANKIVTATASGEVVTVKARVCGSTGNLIPTTTTDAANLAVSGATLSGASEFGRSVTATAAAGVVTVGAGNAGAVGNEFDLRVNYADGEATPAGLTVAVVQPTGGATNPTLTSLITAMGDTWYHVIAHPYTDATSLSAIEVELASRFGPMRMIEGVAITAKNSNYATAAALGATRNSPHSVIVSTNGSPTPPPEYAASVAGVVAKYGAIDPARPLQTLPLSWVKAPAEGDRFTLSNRNNLLLTGISTTRVGGGDLVQIDRLVTTYRLNAAGAADTAYRSLETMLSLMYARTNFRSRIATRYPRAKLGNDSTRYPAGEAVITPAIGRAEAVAWFLDMATASPVVFDPSTLAQFKADLVVERNASDPNRLDFLLPPDLINQLVSTAAQIQFRL